MKKQFFWVVLCAAALTACTSVDVVEEGPQSNAIGFENVIRKPSRATELNSTTFDKFLVYGYYTTPGLESHPIWVFNGDEVKKNITTTTTEDGEEVSTTSWTYNNVRYWNPGATYYFYAYSCNDIALSDSYGRINFPVYSTSLDQLGETLQSRGLRIENYICDAEHQHDLVTAFAEGQIGNAGTNTPVKFTFRHALCKVCVEFVNDLPSGPDYTIEVSNVKISNFQDIASVYVREVNGLEPNYTPGDNERWIWYNQGRSNGEKTIALPNLTDTPNATESVFMIPAYYDNANVALEFSIVVKQGDDVFLQRELKGTWRPVWNAGVSYKYVVHINGENAQLKPIVFEATQDLVTGDSWSGNTPQDMDFSINDKTPIINPDPSTPIGPTE